MEDRHPTVTAAVVAATLLLLRDEPGLEQLAEATNLPAVEAAVRVALPELAVLLDRVPWPLLKRLARGVERIASPGFSLHYALRKSCVRAAVNAAIGEGHGQVVLLGAGFDMMSLALADGATVFEIDHPRSQAVKRRALPDGPVHYVPVDLLVDDVSAQLRAGGIDPRKDTVIAAEGLFMYFDRPRVAAILDELAQFFVARRRLVASFVTPDDRGQVRLHSQRRIVDFCMELLGEQFAFGSTVPHLVELLAERGWTASDVTSTTPLLARLAPHIRMRMPRPTGEVVVTASGTSLPLRVGIPPAVRVEDLHAQS